MAGKLAWVSGGSLTAVCHGRRAFHDRLLFNFRRTALVIRLLMWWCRSRGQAANTNLVSVLLLAAYNELIKSEKLFPRVDHLQSMRTYTIDIMAITCTHGSFYNSASPIFRIRQFYLAQYGARKNKKRELFTVTSTVSETQARQLAIDARLAMENGRWVPKSQPWSITLRWRWLIFASAFLGASYPRLAHDNFESKQSTEISHHWKIRRIGTVCFSSIELNFDQGIDATNRYGTPSSHRGIGLCTDTLTSYVRAFSLRSANAK